MFVRLHFSAKWKLGNRKKILEAKGRSSGGWRWPSGMARTRSKGTWTEAVGARVVPSRVLVGKSEVVGPKTLEPYLTVISERALLNREIKTRGPTK